MKRTTLRTTLRTTPLGPPRRRQHASRGFVLRGAFAMVAFWVVVMALLYLAMDRWQQPRATRVTAEGALVVPRHPDGHFRVAGAVNGEPVLFLVDTGASVVAVSDALARRADLTGTEVVTFHTANGTRTGRIARADAVSLQGGISVANLRVGTGYTGRTDDEALLGQNFLQQFDVEMGRAHMTLRPRAR